MEFNTYNAVVIDGIPTQLTVFRFEEENTTTSGPFIVPAMPEQAELKKGGGILV